MVLIFCTSCKTLIITFIDNKASKVNHSYKDALVVTMQVTNHNFHWMHVDNDSSIDVIFELTYNHVSLALDILKPMSTCVWIYQGVHT